MADNKQREVISIEQLFEVLGALIFDKNAIIHKMKKTPQPNGFSLIELDIECTCGQPHDDGLPCGKREYKTLVQTQVRNKNPTSFSQN